MLKPGRIYPTTEFQYFIFFNHLPYKYIGLIVSINCANKISRYGTFQQPHCTTFIKTYT